MPVCWREIDDQLHRRVIEQILGRACVAHPGTFGQILRAITHLIRARNKLDIAEMPESRGISAAHRAASDDANADSAAVLQGADRHCEDFSARRASPIISMATAAASGLPDARIACHP